MFDSEDELVSEICQRTSWVPSDFPDTSRVSVAGLFMVMVELYKERREESPGGVSSEAGERVMGQGESKGHTDTPGPNKSVDEVIDEACDRASAPDHYDLSEANDVNDALRDRFDDEEWAAWCEGNVLKYAHRWRDKGGTSDLRKAKHYLQLFIEATEADDG